MRSVVLGFAAGIVLLQHQASLMPSLILLLLIVIAWLLARATRAPLLRERAACSVWRADRLKLGQPAGGVWFGATPAS